MYNRETYIFNFFAPLLFIIGGMLAFYRVFIPAGIALILGIAFLISYQGVSIDVEKHKIKMYNRILWFKFGGWLPLGTVQYLTINRYNIRGSQSGYLTGADTGAGVYKSYKVNMVFEGKNNYISLMKGTREEMTGEALKLGKMLNCKVLDYSTHEKKWIL